MTRNSFKRVTLTVTLMVLLAAASAYAYVAGVSPFDSRTGEAPATTAAGSVHAGDSFPGWAVAAETVATAPEAPQTGSPVADGAGGDTMPDAGPRSGNPKSAGSQASVSELAGIAGDEGVAAAIEFATGRGMTVVDDQVTLVIEAAGGAVGAAVLAAEASGATVEAASGNLVQVSVPVGSIKLLASDPVVAYIREPRRPTLSAVSEGVADIGADAWQTAGQDGSGVKLAILDLGFAGYDQRITEGELPVGVTTMSFRSDGDITAAGENHGTACAEIAYDVAPGAQLYLVNFSTDVELANAVDYLKAEGVDVISASWSFFSEFRGDGQGPINDIVQGAVTSGIFWASASGNAARSHWSGVFSDTDADSWSEFSPGDEGDDVYAAAGSRIDVYLTWDRWPVTDQDYDLYLFWSGNPGQAVATSEGWQGGAQAPAEEIHYDVPAGYGGTYWVSIYSYSTAGDARFKLYTPSQDLQYQVPAGSLGGQPTDSPYVMTVGAVPVGATVLEGFSSRGPTVDGRVKPDIVAPDRVSTISYGPAGFWGTSASTPHAAAAAALVRGAWPGWSTAQVQAELESRATDLGDPGKDSLFGAGKLNMWPPPDLAPPTVTSVVPSGTIYTTAAAISVYYDDPGSGIDTASVDVTLDGVGLSGCAVTQNSAVCDVYGIAAGQHSIGGSVSDNAGNTAPISGSFDVACARPALSLGSPQPFWASLEDYQAGLLSVTFSFCDIGPNDASGIELAGSVNTSGVILHTATPTSIGDIAAGACADTTFQYLVPPGVSVFKSTVYITAGDPCGLNYAYPGPLF